MTACCRVLICGLVVFAAGRSTRAAVQYIVTPLPGNGNAPLGINDAGEITGNCQFPGDTSRHAYRYSNGTLTNLGALGTGFSSGTDVNSSGQIVGYSHTTFPARRAFAANGSTMSEVGTLGALTSSNANGINNSGIIVGYAFSESSDDPSSRAFMYDGSMHDLGTLGGSFAEAWDVNNGGQITGTAQDANGVYLPFRTVGGVMQSLGTLPSIPDGTGLAINSSGQVVGYGVQNDHSFFFDGTQMIDLGAGLFALDINDAGVIVGDMSAGPAWVYLNGAVTDLNSLIDPGSGWTLDSALAINNLGQIVGAGDGPGGADAFLLTPVPEPASLGLILIPVSALLRRRR